MSDIVERLRTANTRLNEGDCCGQLDASGTCMAPACIFGEALKMAHEAAAEIERLRAALRPFSKAAEGFDRYNIKNPEEWFCYGGVQGSGETTGAITVGDLRRARAALGEKP